VFLLIFLKNSTSDLTHPLVFLTQQYKFENNLFQRSASIVFLFSLAFVVCFFMKFEKIGFVGAGQMATALAGGFVSAGLIKPENVSAFDISEKSLEAFSNAVPNCQTTMSNSELVKSSEIVILAVKPQIIPNIVTDLCSDDEQTIYVSVMGGIKLDWLVEKLKTDRVVRCMPNTPCLIRKGAIGMSCGSGIDDDESTKIQKLFEAVGLTFVVKEPLIDAVTGLSGSGPAYVFQFIEALADGGVNVGLPRDIAMKLAAQTVVGAGEMVLQTGDHPGVLKDRVASPAGTTIAGIKALEDHGFRSAAINAVDAATRRSIDLGNAN